MYAEAILYCDILDRFTDYNFENKVWYSAYDKKVYKILESILDESFRDLCKNFSCLRIPEVDAIKQRVYTRITKIIEDYIIDSLEYYTYTIVKPKSKDIIYKTQDFNLRLEYDMAIYCKGKKDSRRVDQSSIYLDFLTLKCTGREVKEKHYKDMIYLLKTKNKYIDRVFYTNRIISKINVQFASGVKKFITGYNGGLERVNYLHNQLSSSDFSSLTPYQSNYCDYCAVKDICMGGKETQRYLEVIG